MKEFQVPQSVRDKLKSPLGRLIPDTLVNTRLLTSYFSLHNLTVSVGDRTTERLHELGFVPTLEIVDSREKRISRKSPSWSGNEDCLLKAKNLAGSISTEALWSLKKCLSLSESGGKKLRLEIEGEEDLLALPVIAFYPDGAITFYGQPNEGMVIVSTEDSRKRCRDLLSEIGIHSLD